MATCRVLALDGGGTWALIQVMALSALYGPDATGHRVLRDFNVVAANSAGALVLGGLLENLTLDALLGYFTDAEKRAMMFAPTRAWRYRALDAAQALFRRHWIGPRYSTAAKFAGLQRLLGTTGYLTLAQAARRVSEQAPPHLLIVGFEFDRARAVMFRSTESVGGLGVGEASRITLAEAIHASSNAPVNYFDAPAEVLCPAPAAGRRWERFWDGGVTGMNNPILAAVTEAIQLGYARDEIAALSIGTGHVALAPREPGQNPSAFTAGRRPAGLLASLGVLAGAILDDPPDMASFLAHLMLGAGPNDPPAARRLVRINPLIAPIAAPGHDPPWQAPDGMRAEDFAFLIAVDMDATAARQVAAIRDYAVRWLNGRAPNQPIRMNGTTLACELGDADFPAAKRWWQRISAAASSPSA